VNLKQKARELGVEVEEYPDRVVAKYGNIAEGDFLGAIKCFLETVAIVVAIALASTIVGAAELNPLFLLMAALELLIAPVVAAIVCL